MLRPSGNVANTNTIAVVNVVAIANAIAVAALLGACAGPRGTPDNEPTIKTLAGRSVSVAEDRGVSATEIQAIEAYQKFLDVAPAAPQRAEAMRRIGDLEMESADLRAADAGEKAPNGKSSKSIAATTATAITAAADPDYRAAIARYRAYLETYPADPSNDRVLYQLARAHEQGGDLDAALKTLDRLVAAYPKTRYADEAQFRRGELLFTARDYAKAETAYTTVLAAGPANPYRDRALYMQGWSRFKQGRLDDGLQSFFKVLDLKVANRPGEGSLDTLRGLTRGDRELVEDTFRVTSISLANTPGPAQGADAIGPYIDSPARKGYEFRVYEQLGELYIKQERFKDAADTFGAFARRNPLHAQAPVLQARVITIYEQSGFGTLALDAKKEYVARYGAESDFRRENPKGWERAQPLVKTHVAELARHYHAAAQKSKNTADYQEAVRWYRAYLASFPNDPQAAKTNFLLAELLYEDKRFAEAAVEYEKTAYRYPSRAEGVDAATLKSTDAAAFKGADAGYAALLAYAQQRKAAAPAEQVALQRTGVASALRFADAYGTDPRAGAVLADAADSLFALHDTDAAAKVAQRVLDSKPAADDAQRRIAWTVIAHGAFEKGAADSASFAKAESAYAEVLKLTPEKDPSRADLVERQAAAIYKQGEAARTAGKTAEAVASFQRVGTVAPQSAVRATAQYDAAASQIALKDWDGAIRTLEDFRERYPKNALQADVSSKLAVAYLEKGQWAGAAGEFERLAASSPDPKVAREALWQSAELYEKAGEKAGEKVGEKAGSRSAAAKAYERYLAQNPQPLEPAIEARARLLAIAKADKNTARETTLTREIFSADQNGGGARTPRTRYLGATAALALAEPVAASFKQVALVEPLKKNLKLKKARMEETLKAYELAANYGVADVTTAATFRIASVYRDFGKALMTSERPKKLSKVELEQYNVLLEEQAFPFEEKATELHEVNARRTVDGLYDQWVKASFDALRELRPVRYGKAERSEGVIDAIR